VLLDRDGGLFVNIGSATNSCQVEDRVPYSPGENPCPELDVRAGIWRFSLRSGQAQHDGERFATGLRNTTALDIHPVTGRLWGVQNGRDQLFDNWSDRYTPADDRVAPAEEFIPIPQGQDNGWPYCYEDRRIGQGGAKVLAPEYGGDGQKHGRCRDVAESALKLPAHWAPLSLLFYTGSQFPNGYVNDAFVANHGARFDGPPQGPGYNIVRVRFQNQGPVSWEPFATGFQGTATNLPAGARDRPVGLAQGPDGSLYVTSDQPPGRIFRIIYRGH
jgi:glucose/arabinose dehydrogenase